MRIFSSAENFRRVMRRMSFTTFSAGSFAALQELTKKNFAAFNQALAMFSPFAGATATGEAPPKKANSEGDIDELRTQLSDMQKRLESLAKKTETP